VQYQDAVALNKAGYVSEKAIARRRRDIEFATRQVEEIQMEANSIKAGFGNDIIQMAADLAAHERRKCVGGWSHSCIVLWISIQTESAAWQARQC
jgi:hypothetical protein